MPPQIEPMWYCHQCGSVMHPLMVPDPHCASCNGTFVEMVENPRDDPRPWRGMGPSDGGDFDDLAAAQLPQLQNIFTGPRPGGGAFAFSINPSSPGGNTSTLFFRRPEQTDDGSDRVVPLREFIAGAAGDRGGRTLRDGIPTEHLLINQILGMFAQQPANRQGPGVADPFANILGMPRGGPEGGRLGDYVLSQQALDQIMTTLMEHSNAHRPVPATEEILEKLNREVLEEGSPLLEKDCAVCKDQFSLKTTDPDELVVITLPCKHPFHSPCILPWLKQNGTCPTCRHQLVPQPGSTQNPINDSGSGPGPSTSTTHPPQPTSSAIPEPTERHNNAGGGFFSAVSSLLFSRASGHPNTPPVPSSSDSRSDPLPGSWEPRPSSGPELSPAQPTSFEYDRNSPYSSRQANSSIWDRRRGSVDERTSHSLGNRWRGGGDRERRGRRDRDGQGDRLDQPDLD